MKNTTKKAVVLALGLLAAFGIAQKAHADAIVANDTATIQITITPNTDRGVTIDTQTVVMDLGALDLNVATQTVSPATVTLQGNLTNTELDLSAIITGGWTFESVATSTNTDRLKAWVVFTATTVFATPSKTGDTFDNANDFLGSATATFPGTRVGGSSGNGVLFEDGVGGFSDMDAMNPGMKRHMWFYFATPDVTTTANVQLIRYYLTVKAGS